jgi:hypothetical protein
MELEIHDCTAAYIKNIDVNKFALDQEFLNPLKSMSVRTTT